MIVSMHDYLFKILDTYGEITEKYSYRKRLDIWEPFTSLQSNIEEYLQSHFPTMHVDWSVGQGNWRKEPWIAILDERITNTVQEGYFCGYGFYPKSNYVSLYLLHGVNKIKNQVGKNNLRETLGKRADKMRLFFSNLSDYGFSLDNQVNSNSETSLDAISGIVLNKKYQKDNLPEDSQLSQDLIQLISEYNKYIEIFHPKHKIINI